MCVCVLTLGSNWQMNYHKWTSHIGYFILLCHKNKGQSSFRMRAVSLTLHLAKDTVTWTLHDDGVQTIACFADVTPMLVIQIKICAEYRDMLPRPRLVCQEPGLRPIGRSPGVPDKSSRGLGSMSRYSAQILICFIAYIFSIFNFSVGLVGNLAELPPCTVPPATVHCYQNEAAQCSSDNQISQHALLRGSRKKHSLAFMPQNWWN